MTSVSESNIFANTRLLSINDTAVALDSVAQVQLTEPGVLLSEIVLRIVSDQLAGVRNVEALKAVVTQAVQKCELHVFNINATIDELVQIAL